MRENPCLRDCGVDLVGSKVPEATMCFREGLEFRVEG